MTAVTKFPDHCVSYTPTTDVAAGDVVVRNALNGVAVAAIAANVPGVLAIHGVVSVSKGSGALSAGEPVWWDAVNSQVTNSPQSGYAPLGKVVVAAASGDTEVLVLLTPMAQPYVTPPSSSAPPPSSSAPPPSSSAPPPSSSAPPPSSSAPPPPPSSSGA